MNTLDRRSFLMGSAALAAIAGCGLTGCATPQLSETGEGSTVADPVDVELSCDVAVIGLGASGMLAAIGAADKGASVIAVDAATGFAGTTNCSTTGSFFVESSRELAHSWHVSQQEAYDYIMEGTHYSENPGLVRSMLRVSGRAADIVESSGMPLIYMFEQADENDTEYMNKAGYFFTVSGEERVPFWQSLMDARPAIETRWSTKAEELVVDESGAVTGVICEGPDGRIKINAHAVISCGGGFISNDEMKKKYYGGTSFVSQGVPTVDGSAMEACLAAGAQIGKNFTVSVNEMGGCNYNAVPSYAWIPGTGTNQCLYMFLLGGLLVGRTGKRFVRESRLVTAMMFTGEPLVREGAYYIVMDEAMIDRARSNELLSLFPDEAKAKLAPILQMGFQGFTCDQLDADLEKAVEEGWAYKADTVADLAAHYNLPFLEESVATYNAIPTEGDDELWLEESFVHPVEEGPFYIFQYNPGSWCTMGGIRTDESCRALNAEGEPIAGLYVAGLDADLFSVPYFSGGTAQGFSYASGLLAGETAVEDYSA